MSDHWASRSELSSFISGELSDTETVSHTRHLAHCEDCREELARFHDGLLDDLSNDESHDYASRDAGSGGPLFREIARRADEADAPPRSRFAGWLREPRALWGSAFGVAAVALVLLLLSPEASRRAELDALYLQAASGFPAGTGSPGRLVQPFVPAPSEPVRSAGGRQVDPLRAQQLEEQLLTLDVGREDEQSERTVAVAILRLSRGESASALALLESLPASRHTPMSLSALACAALAQRDEGRIRKAAEVLAAADFGEGAPDEALLLYDRALLYQRLGESVRAGEMLERYRASVPADDPWLAQLESALDH